MTARRISLQSSNYLHDTLAYLVITNKSDCSTLQADRDKIAVWEVKWKMSFHPDKSQVLTIPKKRSSICVNYTLHGHTLEHATSAKNLGCTLNNSLDWGQHIHNIWNKANRIISFLRRDLNIASTSTKETAYTSLVRPTVEYASNIRDPHEKGYIHYLNMVQRRAARYVKNKYHNRSSVTDMLADLEWKSLQERRMVPDWVVLQSHQQQGRSRQLTTHSFQPHIYKKYT
jgi:hypothetical protein